jgi:uncharacterized coiled-coil DUF342 family protein
VINLIKAIPLIRASLKGFMRNWRAIFLLIVFPLLLISVVFLSFNSSGLQKIPVGVIWSDVNVNIEEFEDVVSSFLIITPFDRFDDCILELKRYMQYTCVEVIQENAIILNVHFDNTREPVIWEIIQRIKTAVDLVQKQKSRQIASDFITDFRNTVDKISTFNSKLITTRSYLDDYIEETDDSIIELRNAKSELSDSIRVMDQDISSIKTLKSNVQSQKNNYYTYSYSQLNYVDNSAAQIDNLVYPDTLSLNAVKTGVDELRDEINIYNTLIDSYLIDIDNKIRTYEQRSNTGKQHISQINSKINGLQTIKQDLVSFKSKLEDERMEIENIHKEFKAIAKLDPEILVNPIVIRNEPTYVPKITKEGAERFLSDKDSSQAEKLAKGFNLISLQTIFPTILFLIVLFLALLISSFVCLGEINSSSNKRVRLIKGIFFHEFISVYFSSLLIMILPLISVLLLGNYVFNIPIIENLLLVIAIVFFLSSIFILVGMCLAYLIKNESITLIISTFFLVFLIFFSGFLLPIERMSDVPSTLASHFPGKIALSAFNKVVFYDQGTLIILKDFHKLWLWFISLITLALIIKKFRNV